MIKRMFAVVFVPVPEGSEVEVLPFQGVGTIGGSFPPANPTQFHVEVGSNPPFYRVGASH